MFVQKLKTIASFLIAVAVFKVSIAQTKVDRVIIITTDGLRWQELFTGMDSSIVNRKEFYQDDSLQLFKNYWHNQSNERRKLLMPFFWNKLVPKGQLYGNRYAGNKVDVFNPFRFSYPGYNELFTGFADTTINSNDFPANHNINVLEFLNNQPSCFCKADLIV